jgi:hypothetical protein
LRESKVREGERLLNESEELAEVLRPLGPRPVDLESPAGHRWRNQGDTVRRLKELEREHSHLKRIVADQALDIAMLKELAEGDF